MFHLFSWIALIFPTPVTPGISTLDQEFLVVIANLEVEHIFKMLQNSYTLNGDNLKYYTQKCLFLSWIHIFCEIRVILSILCWYIALIWLYLWTSSLLCEVCYPVLQALCCETWRKLPWRYSIQPIKVTLKQGISTCDVKSCTICGTLLAKFHFAQGQSYQ